MTWIAIIVGVSVWVLLVAYGNLNAYPAPGVHEANDYGERHRFS